MGPGFGKDVGQELVDTGTLCCSFRHLGFGTSLRSCPGMVGSLAIFRRP